MGLRRGKKSKAADAPLPLPNLPPPGNLPAPLPLPPNGAQLPPMPPLPGAQPLPETPPQPSATPEVPAALPPAPLPAMPAPSNDPNTTLSGIAEEKGYNELWAKRSDKPLQQIYGHIDRISNKEAGSLLDRYADRFGHSLDREIIVMRKAAVEEKVAEIRDAPTVELLEDETPDDLTELERVENELRALKPLYQEAKSLGDKETLAELTPTLQALMAQRKALKSGGNTTSQETTTAVAAGEDDDLFVQFVAIVDDLLGEHLPEEIVNAFVESSDFETYREVLGNPAGVDEATRSAFCTMVDDQLGNMYPASIEAFIASPEFEIYRQVGEQYKDA
jgi:hypothetical protein